MPPNVRYALFMTLLVFIGVMGLIIIVMLMGAWRRYLARQQRPRGHAPSSEPTDIWQVSGQRLQDKEGDDQAAR